MENISFKDHPELIPEARIHIFQSVREINDEEETEIRMLMDTASNRWIRQNLMNFVSYDILYKRFIVVVSDKNDNSGVDCSLDTPLNRLINRIEKKHGFGFMDNMMSSYKTGNKIHTVPLREFRRRISDGEIPKNAIVFHTGAHTWGEFKEKWELPLEESWARSFGGAVTQ